MIIAVDAMGGDFAPEQIVQGAVGCLRQTAADLVLVGRVEEITACLGASEHDFPGLRIVGAPGVVGMDDVVTCVLGNRSDSSLARVVEMVKTGEADAAVSAGNSGVFLALAHTRLGTIAGLRRPAIAVLLPAPQGAQVLIDAGANVDCQPVHLAQFAIMGSIYAQYALNIEQPRVGLLNIGHEPSKGNDLTQDAYELLEHTPLNFIGNIEGDDVFGENVDVVVADGFVGNVALKVAEGMAQFAVDEFQERISRSLWSRLGAFVMGLSLDSLKQRFDYANYGGALLLGVEGICVVGHGRSDAQAIGSAISVACGAVQSQIVERLRSVCPKLMPTVAG